MRENEYEIRHGCAHVCRQLQCALTQTVGVPRSSTNAEEFARVLDCRRLSLSHP